MAFEERNLAESMLSEVEIREIAKSLGVPLQDLLRHNSPVYKERKEELQAMGEKELAEVIASEPTLIKRPILKTERGYVIGFDKEKIEEKLI